jgi:hypothetical protein
LYTNVTVSGPVTIWVSGYSWGQFTSKFGNGNMANMSSVDSPDTNTTTNPSNDASSSYTGPRTLDDLKQYGNLVTNAVGSRQGLLYDGDTLAGAVMKISKENSDKLAAMGWTVQGSNPDVKSLWSPESIRPLK